MDTEQFAEFFARQGYRTLKTESAHWYEIQPFCWQSIPYHRLTEPSAAEIRQLFFKNFSLLIRYPCPGRHDPLPGHIWVCDYRDYGLASLAPKTRNQVRRGLENNTIKRVDIALLPRLGWELIRDTAGRQARNTDFANQQRWARYCAAAAGIQDFEAWGAFSNGHLAAFLVGAKVDSHYYILAHASMTASLKHYPNNALIYYLTKLKKSDHEIQVVSYGLDSVEDTVGLRRFKEGMGFSRKPLNQKILINPLVRWIKIPKVVCLVTSLLKDRPENNFLRKLVAILKKL